MLKHHPASVSLIDSPVKPLILRLALPGMLAMIASSTAALFDALILSRSSTQLAAAVSLSFPILTFIQTIGFTLGMGAGSFISRSLGKKDKPSAYRAASTAFYVSILLALVLCALGFAFSKTLVRLLGAQGDLSHPASSYARFVLGAGPLLCASLVLSSILRGQGHVWPNLLAFSLGALTSVTLDLLLVKNYGVTGAGAAMLAREAVTLGTLLFFSFRKKALIRPSLRSFSLCPGVFRDIMQSGLPTLLRQGLMSLSAALFSRTAAAFGDAMLAGTGFTVRIAALVSSAMIGFGQGFQPVCGAAFGAGSMQRVRESYRFCLRCMVSSCALVGAICFLFAGPILSVFRPEGDAIAFARASLRAQSITFAAQGAIIIMNMLTQSMGLIIRASIVATSRQGFVLIPLIMLLPRLFGAAGLILCQSISDLISLLICFWIARSALTCSSCVRGGYWGAPKASQSYPHS